MATSNIEVIKLENSLRQELNDVQKRLWNWRNSRPEEYYRNLNDHWWEQRELKRRSGHPIPTKEDFEKFAEMFERQKMPPGLQLDLHRESEIHQMLHAVQPKVINRESALNAVTESRKGPGKPPSAYVAERNKVMRSMSAGKKVDKNLALEIADELDKTKLKNEYIKDHDEWLKVIWRGLTKSGLKKKDTQPSYKQAIESSASSWRKFCRLIRDSRKTAPDKHSQ